MRFFLFCLVWSLFFSFLFFSSLPCFQQMGGCFFRCLSLKQKNQPKTLTCMIYMHDGLSYVRLPYDVWKNGKKKLKKTMKSHADNHSTPSVTSRVAYGGTVAFAAAEARRFAHLVLCHLSVCVCVRTCVCVYHLLNPGARRRRTPIQQCVWWWSSLLLEAALHSGSSSRRKGPSSPSFPCAHDTDTHSYRTSKRAEIKWRPRVCVYVPAVCLRGDGGREEVAGLSLAAMNKRTDGRTNDVPRSSGA